MAGYRLIVRVMLFAVALVALAPDSASAGAAEATFDVTFVDELEPLYPDSSPREIALTEPVRLDAARGTIAGVHLLLRGLPAGASLAVSAGPGNGPASKAKFYRLLDVPVEINSGLHSRTEKWDGRHNPHVIRRAPFRVYDAMKPVDSTIRIDQPVIALAVQFPIRADTAPGAYPLVLRIEVGDEHLARAVTLRIHDALVPPAGRDTLRYTNWYSTGDMLRGTDIEPWSDAFWDILGRHAALMAKGRQNTFRLPFWPRRDEHGRIVFDRQRMRRMIDVFGRHGLWYVEGTHFVREGDGGLITGLGGNRVRTPEGTAELIETLARIGEVIEEEGLAGRWFQHIKDEPGGHLTEDYKHIASLIHEHLPGVPVLEATVTRSLTGAVDIWCPTVDEYQKHRPFFLERQGEGDEVWVYTCLTPTGPWVNRLIDMERMRPVYIGWGAARFGTTGFLHWGFNRFIADPFEQSVVDHPQAPRTNNQLPAGDTHVVYPGRGEPWSSTRFEAHRIGLEDHELLRRLHTVDEDAARRILSSVFRGYDDYETDVSAYRLARRRLLEAVSRAGSSRSAPLPN